MTRLTCKPETPLRLIKQGIIAFALLFTLACTANAATVNLENTLAAHLEQQSSEKNKVNLTVSPEKCVAMQQGQTCYMTVELFWQAEVQANYCLYSSLKPQPLQCWNNSRTGEMTKEFSTKENLVFFLQIQDQHINLASAKVKMAWVHKKKGKPRMSWRLF